MIDMVVIKHGGVIKSVVFKTYTLKRDEQTNGLLIMNIHEIDEELDNKDIRFVITYLASSEPIVTVETSSYEDMFLMFLDENGNVIENK